MTTKSIELTVNGMPRQGIAEPRMLLTDFIRDVLGLTGTHVGAEHGVCGACTVQLDGEPVRSCLMFAIQVQGSSLRTIEGLAPDAAQLSVIQQHFTRPTGSNAGFARRAC